MKRKLLFVFKIYRSQSDMYFNKKIIIAIAIGLPLMGAVLTGVAIGHHELYIREDTITGYLCPPIKIESISDSNAAEGFELSKQVVAEGSVLVKNDNNVLPLKDNQKKVNVFGHGAIDWIIGGSGSGQVISESGIDNILFLDALDHYGITYNTELTDAYRNWYGALGTIDSLNQQNSQCNTSLNNYKTLYNNLQTVNSKLKTEKNNLNTQYNQCTNNYNTCNN